MGEAFCRGADACGDKAEIRFHDMVTADAATVAAELAVSDAFLLGTPTIIGEALAPIWNLTLSLFAPVHGGKLASAFGSYGWSGEGVPHIIERLRQLRMNVPDDGFRVRLKPSETQRELREILLPQEPPRGRDSHRRHVQNGRHDQGFRRRRDFRRNHEVIRKPGLLPLSPYGDGGFAIQIRLSG